MSSTAYRHKRIAAVVAGITLLCSSLFGFAVNANANSNQNEYESALIEHSQQETYRNVFVVAADPAANPDLVSGEALKLSMGLNSILIEQVPADISVPPGLHNDLEEVIGVNPFEGLEFCDECGMFTDITLAQLEQAGMGFYPVVGEAPVLDTNNSFTGLNTWVEFAILYNIFGAIGLTVALSFLSDPKMSWVIGDGRDDLYQSICVIFAPLAAAIYIGLINKRQRVKAEEVVAERLSLTGAQKYISKFESRIGLLQESDNPDAKQLIKTYRNKISSLQDAAFDAVLNEEGKTAVHSAKSEADLQEALFAEQAREEQMFQEALDSL